MTFLNENDYKKQIRAWVKNLITYEDANVLADAELAAQAEMETFLMSRYDTVKIFNPDQPTGERNALIVMYLIDITLYHLHSNIQPNDVPQIRYERYNRAISWLRDVNAGKISPNLPEIEPQENEEITGNIFLGSNDKVSERF